MWRDTCHVASAELIISDTEPKHLSLRIRGYHSDGCRFPLLNEQTRKSNHVRVHAFREMPKEIACPAVMMAYNVAFELEGTFESGNVSIQVNNFLSSQEI